MGSYILWEHPVDIQGAEGAIGGDRGLRISLFRAGAGASFLQPRERHGIFLFTENQLKLRLETRATEPVDSVSKAATRERPREPARARD
jgi:hypothetical protein